MQETPTTPNSEASPAANGEGATPPASNRSALLIVFLVVFIDLLGFGIVLPMLPKFADTYIADLVPGGKNAALGGLLLGLLMSSFSLMQFLFSPLWGRLSDRIGRRPILLLGLAGSVIFYALLGFACEQPAGEAQLALILLFLARIGAGIAGATIATAQAVIADSTPPEKRKHGMALIGAAFGIGFTFGPLLGALGLRFFKQNPGIPGFLASGLSLVALLLGARLLPETRKLGGPSARRSWLPWAETRQLLNVPTVGLLILIFFLATVGFAAFEPTLALLIGDTLQIDMEDIYLAFAYVGFVLLVTQGYLYRKLAKRWSEKTFITWGTLLMGAGLAGLGVVAWISQTESPPGFRSLLTGLLATMTVAVIGFAFLTPSVQALISRRSDPARQGEILGVNQSASALARIVGPVLGLVLYKLHPSHLLPYALGAVLLFCMLPLIPRLGKD